MEPGRVKEFEDGAALVAPAARAAVLAGASADVPGIRLGAGAFVVDAVAAARAFECILNICL